MKQGFILIYVLLFTYIGPIHYDLKDHGSSCVAPEPGNMRHAKLQKVQMPQEDAAQPSIWCHVAIADVRK